MEYLSLLPSTAVGYLTFRAATHPNSRVWNKLQRMRPIKIKRVQVFPSIRIYLFGRTIHLHHWISLSILLGFSVVAYAGFLDYMFTRGILLGGIIQGLSLPKEHRKIIYHQHPTLPPFYS